MMSELKYRKDNSQVYGLLKVKCCRDDPVRNNTKTIRRGDQLYKRHAKVLGMASVRVAPIAMYI